MLPVLRDQDGYIYAREWSGGIMAGGFEPISKPIFSDGVPSPFEFQKIWTISVSFSDIDMFP